MLKVGLPLPKMKEEDRIALLPDHIAVIDNPDFLYFQKGYGRKFGVTDRDYKNAGANVVSGTAARSLDVLCQPKFCELDVPTVQGGQTIFGWLHLGANDFITRELADEAITAIAWENMSDVAGKHVFYKNNFLTGEMGVLHAMAYAGRTPDQCYVAIIGRGAVGKGAMSTLKKLGIDGIDVFHTENIHELPPFINHYDVIINCACTSETILTKEDLRRMKQGALLIDIGSACIEGEHFAESIYAPITPINGGQNLAYSINHVPTLAYRTAVDYIGEDVAPYINMLIKQEMDATLRNAVVIDQGNILI
jgi:N5-(carboxyethyl)ornithine synthase